MDGEQIKYTKNILIGLDRRSPDCLSVFDPLMLEWSRRQAIVQHCVKYLLLGSTVTSPALKAGSLAIDIRSGRSAVGLTASPDTENANPGEGDGGDAKHEPSAERAGILGHGKKLNSHPQASRKA